MYKKDIKELMDNEITREVFGTYYEKALKYNKVYLPRFSDIIELCPKQKGLKIVDIGIAYGIVDVYLKTKFKVSIAGLELPNMIERYCGLCKKYEIPVRGFNFLQMPIPYSDNSLDVVILAEVLEHLRMVPDEPLNEIKRVLKVGGHLIITVPNIARAYNILRLIDGENILPPLTKGNHVTDSWTHIREFTKKEMIELLQNCGYKVEKIMMGLNGRPRMTRLEMNDPEHRSYIEIRAVKL